MATSLVVAALVGLSAALTPGSTPEVHPKLTTYRCTAADGCSPVENAVVLDSLAHPVHQINDTSAGCGSWGSAPPEDVCPDKETCHQNCIIEGVSDYAARGITTDGDALTLEQLDDAGNLQSPRVYLLAEDEEHYEMMHLNDMEFTFDVDVSRLPCGMNGALYLSEMYEDGGRSDLNPLGATYGTGYCDAQCFVTPFINGEGNIDGYGSCCNEMDIWEANSRATHLAPHVCNQTGVYLCEGEECQFDGVCDKNGCALNPYRMGNYEYYGHEMVVDTTRPFTVVTQFLTTEGELTSIHRLYVQDGKAHSMPIANISGLPEVNFVNDEWCDATGSTRYMDLGATAEMGRSLDRGMVLAFSIWWDEGGNMNWLDSEEAGPCSADEGNPTDIVVVEPSPVVTYSNIRWGELGSTYEATCEKKKHKNKRFTA